MLLELSDVKLKKFHTFFGGEKPKISLIQNWIMVFSIGISAWFDRARRALQNSIYWKDFRSVFWGKKMKKSLENWKKLARFNFFNKIAFSHYFIAKDVSKYTSHIVSKTA